MVKGGMYGKGWGHEWRGPAWRGCVAGGAWQGGLHGGGAWQGGLHAGETATEAGGTHPPGMHSCLTIKTFCCSMK